jgi:hypothetical protein
MDDEAIIRVTLVICVSLVVGITLLIVSIGWAHNQGAPIAQANANAVATASLGRTCRDLAPNEQVACINAIATAPATINGTTARQQAVAVCDTIVGDDRGIVTCIAAAMGTKVRAGNIAGPSSG